MTEVRAIVVRAAGINCDMETDHALELAGAKVERVHINRDDVVPGSTDVGCSRPLQIQPVRETPPPDTWNDRSHKPSV